MSEAIQAKRRREHVQDWLATLAVAGFLAAVAALLCDGLIMLAGLVLGDPAWHRSWVDQRLAHALEWLGGVPVLGAFVGILGQPNTWLPSGGTPWDLIALFVFLYGPMVIPAKRIGPTLIARYDDETLRVWPSGDYGLRWAGPLGEAQRKAWQALSDWCFAGVGDGSSPFWRPWVLPRVEQRFSIAILTGPNGVGKSHLAEALSRELDGSIRLEACTSRLAGLRLRLGVKLNDSAWWKPRRREDPWDSGYLVEDPAVLVRLAGFLPRRATLLVADELSPQTLLDAITRLKGRRADFRHPVRLLIIDTVLPGSLGLGLDAERRVWTTNIHELGDVPVVSLSDVRFAPPEFRGLVGAQVGADGQRMQLLGRDVTWQPLIEALDGQPVLLAESIRQVREQKTTFESLCGDNDLADKHASPDEQAKREAVMLPADILGVRRALLRERLLGGRAQHRKQAIRAALGADTAGGEEAYYALMVATLAGGCASPRLCKLLGWTVDKLGDERLARVFGRDATPKWIPPIKPAVIADEMLRDHFRAPRNAALDEESRQHIARALHIAWLCNPAGTLRTVARWVARRQHDDFAQALATPPGLDLLTEVERLPGLSPAETRVEIARAFFELAVCHDGELAVAEAAMGALDKEELTLLGRQVDALLSRPEVRGLPALILWLQLEARCWPDLATLGQEKTREFGLKLLGCTEHLVRQSRLMAVWETPLQAALEAALKESLPRVAELADACAPDVTFRQAAWALDQSARQDPGVLQDLRQRLRTALAASLAGEDALPSGEPAPWARALLARLASLDLGEPRPPDIAAWLAGEAGQEAASPEEAEAWAKARLLSLMAFAVSNLDPDATEKAAQRLADIAGTFPHHEGIQRECALAWGTLAWAHQDHDPDATEKAAQRVADITGNFPHHEGIQRDCAMAWRTLAWAHQDHDPDATEKAAQRVADIAGNFPLHVGIQRECASAWRLLAWAHKDHDPAATEKAAQRVANIASTFPHHEGIQHECAIAWRYLAWAHKDQDPAATEKAAQRVADIASTFPHHEGIQHECAIAWRYLAWAHKDQDPAATEKAAQRVADIAGNFPHHEDIQHECAVAWRHLAWAHQGHDPVATEKAAQRVADIADTFPHHEGIQRECANSWRLLAWVHKDHDPAVTEKAAQRVADIAGTFPHHEGVQRECANTWRLLAWAHSDHDPDATEKAARRVADIASNFPDHEGIQHECAETWRHLAWSHQGHDPLATEKAAQRVADIAVQFPQHEAIQLECSRAWQYLAWAHKDQDPVATEKAAQRVAIIASNFPHNERIQFECAEAWRYVVDAAVRIDDGKLIDQALDALDDLAGLDRQGRTLPTWNPRPTFPGVLQERDTANAMVKAWREAQATNEAPQ